jgi:hypothetical protein
MSIIITITTFHNNIKSFTAKQPEHFYFLILPLPNMSINYWPLVFVAGVQCTTWTLGMSHFGGGQWESVTHSPIHIIAKILL